MPTRFHVLALLLVLPMIGCEPRVRVDVEHVAPITIDVNLKVQRELDNEFDFRWKDNAQTQPAGATAPANGGGQ